MLDEARREARLFAAAAPGAVAAPPPAPPARPARRATRRRSRARRPALALTGVVAALVLGGLAASQVAGPPTRTVTATLTARASADAQAELEVGGQQSRLRVRGLFAAGEGRVYQVWVRPAGEDEVRPTTALFDVTRAGEAVVAVPREVREGDEVLVTSEPAGGSRVPTRPPVLRAAA